MRREFSASLDLLRLLAASAVFFGHLGDVRFGGQALGELDVLHAPHSAVVVFFILSGCVISWAAKRDKYPAKYVVSRAARIYSVAIPALILTYIADVATGNITYQILQPWKYVPLFLSFTTDFWFLHENAFSNAPWWSLCYEVWYYVVFGIVFFGRGRWRWVLAGLCLAVMGPRLWLLFPLWLAGAAIHRMPRLRHAHVVLAAAILGIVVLKWSGIEDPLNHAVNLATHGFAKAQLRYSQYFVGDYIFGALVWFTIWALRDAELAFFGRIQKVLSAMASVSFSIYLVHFPLLLAYAHVFPNNMYAIGGATLVSVVIFGLVFERNKHIARAWITRLLTPLPIWPAPAVATAEAGGGADLTSGGLSHPVYAPPEGPSRI